jgi:hypothetical protein
MAVQGQAKDPTQLRRIKRMACLAITGDYQIDTPPTAAMKVLLNLTPLDLLIMAEAGWHVQAAYN